MSTDSSAPAREPDGEATDPAADVSYIERQIADMQVMIDQLDALGDELGAMWYKGRRDAYRDALGRMEGARAEIERLRAPVSDPGRTHYPGCHTERGHHECALAEIERLRGAVRSTIVARRDMAAQSAKNLHDIPRAVAYYDGECSAYGCALQLIDGEIEPDSSAAPGPGGE